MVGEEELHREDGDVSPGRELKEDRMKEKKMVSLPINDRVEPRAVVIFGTIKEGFRVRGPFKDVDEASHYAQVNIEPEYLGDWEVATLESPGTYLEKGVPS